MEESASAGVAAVVHGSALRAVRGGWPFVGLPQVFGQSGVVLRVLSVLFFGVVEEFLLAQLETLHLKSVLLLPPFEFDQHLAGVLLADDHFVHFAVGSLHERFLLRLFGLFSGLRLPLRLIVFLLGFEFKWFGLLLVGGQLRLEGLGVAVGY